VTEKADTLFTLYAKDREDAERQAEEILQEYGYEWPNLKEYPHGFKIVMTYLPGRIEPEPDHRCDRLPNVFSWSGFF